MAASPLVHDWCMTDLTTLLSRQGGPVPAVESAALAAAGSSPEGFARSLADLLAGVVCDEMTPDVRAEWLRACSVFDAAVTTHRARVMSTPPGVRTQRAVERSTDLVRTTGMSRGDARPAVRMPDTLAAMLEAADALAASHQPVENSKLGPGTDRVTCRTPRHQTATTRQTATAHRPTTAHQPGTPRW